MVYVVYDHDLEFFFSPPTRASSFNVHIYLKVAYKRLPISPYPLYPVEGGLDEYADFELDLRKAARVSFAHELLSDDSLKAFIQSKLGKLADGGKASNDDDGDHPNDGQDGPDGSAPNGKSPPKDDNTGGDGGKATDSAVPPKPTSPVGGEEPMDLGDDVAKAADPIAYEAVKTVEAPADEGELGSAAKSPLPEASTAGLKDTLMEECMPAVAAVSKSPHDQQQIPILIDDEDDVALWSLPRTSYNHSIGCRIIIIITNRDTRRREVFVLRAGKPSPSDSQEKELADDLRAAVADEYIKRRSNTLVQFVEGDFDTYVAKMRQPHVWGGEPELLMSSYVLQLPIVVHMWDKKKNCLQVIAEYGQEYGKENPIRVLYHGYGHYDGLQTSSDGLQSKLSRRW
ncbi:hypothetical protein ACS0TY_009155 [Phlomoides rotata]